MVRFRSLTVALASIGALAGCASEEPTFGERLQAEGASLAAIGDQWVEGQTKLERGEELIEEGNELVEEGQKKLEKGERLVEEGRRMMETSEGRYEALGQATSATDG